MNEVPITRSVLNVNLQHKGKAKNNIKNAFHSNELSFIEQRQKNQKHSKKHKNTTEDISGEENFSSPWRLISSVLGVMCILMAVAIAATVFSTNLSSERQCPMIQQKGPHHPCPENWVWFRCSCYYFSKETLTWRESQQACLSLNSSLIRISREEMEFFSFKNFFWVGVYYNKTSRQWLWENHSVLPSEMFYGLETNTQGNCVTYQSKETCYAEKCTTKQQYICKKYNI
ncbi:killer cell lectin-like receptor subfamily E member 1 [Cricetulus griseus]|uniref:Killer cell lectin-like receptor subfamily E member 1 n=2 Tax=Cricetulus griseus TaxID=10029 RepID=A0A9J7KC62_CRIGR|nr:killer cell lectin-like receptor subfamily E member 1 [Cricetulus griseus]XP_027285635.1 killer cell lectin-like receptor subfamily E member 1 [Cricetulus griseus]XP_027297124.1 killer cell lectin-like receptor subfamily E member 1 [Cricetulus griseus]XP_027297126.1 killer cell lectin-like receptor subfamily E member 1 [Cricetulus griseus]XP_035304425.1 killer cell lectin-like receptor subfamily E member 1 [Cricetulus griseus]